MKIAIISDIHGNLEALKTTKVNYLIKVNENFKKLGINPDEI